ncbi:MAG: YggS family pyridoxal phosphate enzyme [Firmicutes bacterium ZCTH02-B6]|nr:MAG: YggS family pyridoxal phosphate enzyme [Firmicutes bacterium ZCTH02-B6]
MENFAENLARIRGRISAAAERVGRDPADVTLIAVTKNVDAATVQQAVAAGVADIGENRVQEARAKFPFLPAGVRRHMIGHLQTNKVKQCLELFDVIHSLDRWSLAEAVSRRAQALGTVVPVLVQVNVAGEETKHGLAPGEVLSFVRMVAELPGLAIRGLMTMAPLVDDPEAARPVFRELRRLADQVADAGIRGVSMEWLSMGMSNDFEMAVEEGATMVRIGTSLFGPRRP